MSYDNQSGMPLPGQPSPARSGSMPVEGAPATPFSSGGVPGTPQPSFPAQPAQSAGRLRARPATGASVAGAAPAQALAAAPAPAKTTPGRRPRLEGAGAFLRGLSERQAASLPAQSPPPLSGRARFILQFVMMLVFLGAIWFIVGKAGSAQPGIPATNPSNGQPTIGAPGSMASTASPGKTVPLSAEQVTATFLQDFFTWDGGESDQTYITKWAQFVTPRVVATLDTAAPRLLLDSGNDSAAQSPAPTIPGGSAQVQGQNAQVQATWTIQVALPSAEQVIWQTRQIQAAVWLMQSGTTWLVTNLTWQSSSS